MTSSSKYQRTLQELLDSDDELTSDYSDTSFVPAYQDDSRFEYYEENNKTYKGLIDTRRHECTAIFNKKDAYCFKCIQRRSSYDTSLWFFKFLLYKDIQSNYKFLKSCLILKYEDCYFKQAFKSKLSNSVS